MCCFLLCKVECCFLLCVLVSVVFYCVQTSVCGSGDYRLPPLGIWSPAWEWINPWRTCSQFLELLILYHPSPSQKYWHAWEKSCSALQIAALKPAPAPFPPRQEAAAGKSTRFIREKPELTSGLSAIPTHQNKQQTRPPFALQNNGSYFIYRVIFSLVPPLKKRKNSCKYQQIYPG